MLESPCNGPGCCKSASDPFSGGDADGISHQSPARTGAPDGFRGLGPIVRKTLEPLCIAQIRSHDFSVGEQDRGWRGYADGGSTFQSGNGIDCPAQAPDAFGPIEATGRLGAVGFRIGGGGRSCIVCEQYGSRVVFQGGQQVNAPSALREAQAPGIHYAIGPMISEGLQCTGDVVHCAAAIELQHERYVFQEDPGRPVLLHESEDFPHQAGAQSGDSSGLAGLAEILARESGYD